MSKKQMMTLTEVNEIVDEKEMAIDTLKNELRSVSSGFATLKRQASNNKGLSSLLTEKTELQNKYNELLEAEKRRKEAEESSKKERQEKWKQTKIKLDSFLEEMRKIREE